MPCPSPQNCLFQWDKKFQLVFLYTIYRAWIFHCSWSLWFERLWRRRLPCQLPQLQLQGILGIRTQRWSTQEGGLPQFLSSTWSGESGNPGFGKIWKSHRVPAAEMFHWTSGQHSPCTDGDWERRRFPEAACENERGWWTPWWWWCVTRTLQTDQSIN